MEHPTRTEPVHLFAHELQAGDTYAGATVTTGATLAAHGGVVIEVDWRDQIWLPAYRIVQVTR